VLVVLLVKYRLPMMLLYRLLAKEKLVPKERRQVCSERERELLAHPKLQYITILLARSIALTRHYRMRAILAKI
jgi:hypothetical protein